MSKPNPDPNQRKEKVRKDKSMGHSSSDDGQIKSNRVDLSNSAGNQPQNQPLPQPPFNDIVGDRAIKQANERRVNSQNVSTYFNLSNI